MSSFHLFILLLLAHAAVSIPYEQRNALIDFYEATNGAGWQTKTNWLNLDPCDNEWYGVKCESVGETMVIGISLPSNNLKGTLPSSLSSLINLNYVHLTDNSLSGPITPFTFLLSKHFTHFDVQRNQFSGSPISISILFNNREVENKDIVQSFVVIFSNYFEVITPSSRCSS